MHRVERTVGQTEIVEDIVEFLAWNLAPDRCFNLVGQTRGLFYTGSCSCASVQNEFAGVRTGKEVLTKKRH